jgi:hypothetical protein
VKMQTRRGLLPAGPRAGRAIATSGTSAVGSVVAIDTVNVGDIDENSMTRASLRRWRTHGCGRARRSGDGEGHGGGSHDQHGDGGGEHGDTGCDPGHEPIAAGPDGCPSRRQGRHCRAWMDWHRTALLDARGQRNAYCQRGSEEPARSYSAALARNAAMSMMKPDANQTTSTGMMEFMGTRTSPVNASRHCQSFSVASRRYGSFRRAMTNEKM